MGIYREYIYLFIVAIVFISSGCRLIDIGGAGWDEERDIEEAKSYPTTESKRIKTATEEIPFGTFKQEFETVFQDFPNSGNPISSAKFENTKTQIGGTPYSISYEQNVLKILRDGVLIAEKKLPRVFYMHPMLSGAVSGNSQAEDIILCRTQSRATTGLHYILIIDGRGEILFEKVMGAAEDWDILPGKDGDIVIGGARIKTTITKRK